MEIKRSKRGRGRKGLREEREECLTRGKNPEYCVN